MEADRLLKVLVGSQAHGLAGPDSDFDYRGVFVVPTNELLRIGGSTQQTQWMEGKVDDTSWEVGRFLYLATKCNPTILECFLAPVREANGYGHMLRYLFDDIWSSRGVLDAFVGYGLNQRKKFLDKKDDRSPKYACAYLRTLYNAWELLDHGAFSIDMRDTPIYQLLQQFKYGACLPGEVIQVCCDWEERVRQAYADRPDKQTNLDAVNDVLLQIRAAYP